MTPQEARELIERGEGQRTEFKTSFAEQNKAIESLCAFTHADGGTVFFGVKPDGTVCGVDIGTNTLESLSHVLRTNTRPQMYPRVHIVELEQKDVVAVTIEQAKPGQVFHAFKIPYVRVGRTNEVMSPEDQRARLLEWERQQAAEEPPVSIAAATSASGQDGFVWVYNPGVAERFCVRISGFEVNNPGLELKAIWSNAEEERVIKKGDRDWCRIMQLEPDKVRVSYFQGELYIPIGKQEAFSQENERRRRGVRIVRFLGQSSSRDIVVAQGVEYGLDVMVLSDTRDPVTERIAYGIGRETLVMPFDQDRINTLVEEDLKVRRDTEELMKRYVPTKSDPEMESPP